MNIFSSRKMNWWQVGVLKLSLLSLGIAIGAYWWEALWPYITWFLIVGVVLAIWSAISWMGSR